MTVSNQPMMQCNRPSEIGASYETNDRGALSVQAVSGGLEAVDQIADEWRKMLEGIVDDPPYWRPEWIRAALRARWATAEVKIITVRQQGRLCAVLPLKLEKEKFGLLRARKLTAPATMWGVGMDVISSPEVDQGKVIAALWDFLKTVKGWDVLEFPSVLQGAKLERLLEQARQEKYLTGGWATPPIAYFPIPNGPSALKELGNFPRHPKLRSKVKNREGKLAALGPVRLVRLEKASPEQVQQFYEMEAGGRKGQGSGAILADPSRKQFFDEVIEQMQVFNYFCLYRLELNEQPIAAHIGCTHRGRYWAAKSAYDEKYRDYAPGHVIVKAILRDCAERGISEYVMGIREDWKMEWTQHTRTRSFQCIFNRGTWPFILHACSFGARAAQQRLRHLLKPAKPTIDSQKTPGSPDQVTAKRQ